MGVGEKSWGRWFLGKVPTGWMARLAIENVQVLA